MKFRNMTRIGAVTVLSVGMLNGVLADDDARARVRVGDAEAKADVNLPGGDDKISRDRDDDRREIRTEARIDKSQVAKIHKASNLTGMNVVNRQNEKLGDVKDIVMDLPSGRISYVVISVGGFLGIGDKLIAVPPKAFSFSTTQDNLILDADKVKIQAAPGFVQTAWPSVDDPEFSSYWQITDQEKESVGTSGSTSEIRRQRSSDRDLDRNDTNRKTDN